MKEFAIERQSWDMNPIILDPKVYPVSDQIKADDNHLATFPLQTWMYI